MKITKADLEEWRHHFTDRQRAALLFDTLTEKFHKTLIDKHSNYINAESWNKAFRYLLQIVINNNLNIIFKHAESEIEQIFLNALNAASFSGNPFMIIFTPPLPSATASARYFSLLNKAIDEKHQKFISKTGKGDLSDFVEYLSLSLNDASESDLHYSLLFLVTIYRVFPYDKAFHLTLQPSLEDIIINGKSIRPDVFVWIPSKPSFKLIIECDSWTYHSDKQAFSGDRARDRALQREGFQVMRFSGQQIFHDPFGSAIELLNYFHERHSNPWSEGNDSKQERT